MDYYRRRISLLPLLISFSLIFRHKCLPGKRSLFFTYPGKKIRCIFISLPGFSSCAEQENDLEFNRKNSRSRSTSSLLHHQILLISYPRSKRDDHRVFPSNHVDVRSLKGFFPDLSNQLGFPLHHYWFDSREH